VEGFEGGISGGLGRGGPLWNEEFRGECSDGVVVGLSLVWIFWAVAGRCRGVVPGVTRVRGAAWGGFSARMVGIVCWDGVPRGVGEFVFGERGGSVVEGYIVL